MSLPDSIKLLVSMSDAAQFYGYEPNFAGFIKCPFHADKTASMKVYSGDRGFHCFGCHTGGSVIDFVMKLFNLSFWEACVRLNEDFRLGLTNDKPDPKIVAQRRTERQERDRRQRLYESEYRTNCDEYRMLYHVMLGSKDWNDALCYAIKRLAELDRWFEENLI